MVDLADTKGWRSGCFPPDNPKLWPFPGDRGALSHVASPRVALGSDRGPEMSLVDYARASDSR
jgi:hypothetical protein